MIELAVAIVCFCIVATAGLGMLALVMGAMRLIGAILLTLARALRQLAAAPFRRRRMIAPPPSRPLASSRT